MRFLALPILVFAMCSCSSDEWQLSDSGHLTSPTFTVTASSGDQSYRGRIRIDCANPPRAYFDFAGLTDTDVTAWRPDNPDGKTRFVVRNGVLSDRSSLSVLMIMMSRDRGITFVWYNKGVVSGTVSTKGFGDLWSKHCV